MYIIWILSEIKLSYLILSYLIVRVLPITGVKEYYCPQDNAAGGKIIPVQSIIHYWHQIHMQS